MKSVAVLPEQTADTRVYETILTIDGEVDQLKPGMTAVVEIHVRRLPDVLSVPVQAVMQVGAESWCYVEDGSSGPERRKLSLGLTNHKFIEVRQGLAEGERVVLNPMAIVDDAEQSKAPPQPAIEQPAANQPLPPAAEAPAAPKAEAAPRKGKRNEIPASQSGKKAL